MSELVTPGDTAAGSKALASRERAASRMHAGVLTVYAGGGSLVATLLAAGLSGFLAVAEMFESFFLDSAVLAGLDTWGLGAAVVFALVGGVLLRLVRQAEDE